MPKYPWYVVIQGAEPGVYESWSECAPARGDDLQKAVWEGCLSQEAAVRLFRAAKKKGNIRTYKVVKDEAEMKEEAEDLDVPVSFSPARDRSEDPSARMAAPGTSSRGTSHQGTSARGRARNVSVQVQMPPTPPHTLACERDRGVDDQRLRRDERTSPHRRIVRVNPDVPAKQESLSTLYPRTSQSVARRDAPAIAPRVAEDIEDNTDSDSDSPSGREELEDSPLATDVDAESEPESASAVVYSPSPRRLHKALLSSPASHHYQTPPITRESSALIDTPTGKRSKSSRSQQSVTPRMITMAPSQPDPTDRENKFREDSPQTTGQTMTTSPPTLQTQVEDGELPLVFQRARASNVKATREHAHSELPPTLADSISGHMRAQRSSRRNATAPRATQDLVPTRPNTPQMSTPKSKIRPKVLSMDVCTSCEQPCPNPPLAAPSLDSPSDRHNSKLCARCFQPLPRVPPSSSVLFTPSGKATTATFVDPGQVPIPPSPLSTSSAIDGLSDQLNILGLSSATRNRKKRHSGTVDPRSPLQRSDTVSEIGSPRPFRRKKPSSPLYPSLSNISF